MTATSTGPLVGRADPLVLALARYIEALHRRYPEGPAELRCQVRAMRANMPPMAIERLGRTR